MGSRYERKLYLPFLLGLGLWLFQSPLEHFLVTLDVVLEQGSQRGAFAGWIASPGVVPVPGPEEHLAFGGANEGAAIEKGEGF
jgi:hypothetical protein